jgi:hypothetical protein
MTDQDKQREAEIEKLREVAQKLREQHPQNCAAQQGNKCNCGLIQ